MKRPFLSRARSRIAAVATSMALSVSASALTESGLSERLQQRFEGDRSGACVLAALIDGARVVRGQFCARDARPPSPGDAFEIGSISKTMIAFLVADLISQRRWTLDDPIALHLPDGTRVPRLGGQEIRVRHLLTHTSGLPALPPGMAATDPANPYADLTSTALLEALAATRLERAPGARAEYSNFAMMLLSYAVARAYGGDLEATLRTRLFEPLGMRGAAIRRSDDTHWVQGHTPGGTPTPAWSIAPQLAGVGMVRASLDDLVRYLQAQLNDPPGPLGERLQTTRRPLAAGYAMNWALTTVDGHALVLHEGATGGFSSLVMFEPDAGRGIVLLADTALGDLGGLTDTALSLLLDRPMQKPRRTLPAPPALLQAISGDYVADAIGLRLKLWVEDGRLRAQAQGQPAQTLGYDSHGDFHAQAGRYVLRPLPAGTRVDRLQLRQGGGLIEARRVGIDYQPRASNPAWVPFAGEYGLQPGFTIRVFEQAGQLMVQGSGQPAIAARQTGADRITIEAVNAVITFQRDAAGNVVSATLQQSGQVLTGAKLP